MKSRILTFVMLLICSAVFSQRQAIKSPQVFYDKEPVKCIDTTTLNKADEILTEVAKLDTAKLNQIIDLAGLDDTTATQLKSILGDVPEVANKADDIVKIIKGKDEYGSTMEFWVTLLGAIGLFLTSLAAVVKKIRALPSYMSPIYWFDKIFGHGKTWTTDPDGNKVKATVRKVKVPDGYEIKYVKMEAIDDTKYKAN